MKHVFLILSMLTFQMVYTQTRFQLPPLSNPSLPNSLIQPNSKYQNLLSQYLIKTTKNYELSGNVKSVHEVITLTEKDEKQVRKNEYEFLKNHNLVKFECDTLEEFIYSGSIIEKYTYDSTQTQIIESIIMNGFIGTITHSYFDEQGYMSKKKYEQPQRIDGSVKEHEIDMFDYTVNYQWNKTRDSVCTDYHYKTNYDRYQREKNRCYNFGWEIKRLNKETIEPVSTNSEIPREPFLKDHVLFSPMDKIIELDSNGNITRYTLLDNTIKNSYNLHQQFDYEYNDKNELTRILFSYSTDLPNFLPEEEYTIEYLKYDTQGNWIEKKVKQKRFRPPSDYSSEKVYYYTREIAYY